jgi:uncharacterized membrane protein YhaH (DUF805 family)
MFKNPFSFEGRIRRLEYGITFIIYIVFYVITMALSSSGSVMGSVIVLVLIIPVLWFLWAQGAKRCHDLDKSGWYQIIPFYFLVLLFQDGAPGTNRFGRNPKGIAGPDDPAYLDPETLDGHLRA